MSIDFKRHFLFGLLVASIVLFPSIVHAQQKQKAASPPPQQQEEGYDINKLREFPSGESVKLEDFEAKTDHVSDVPFNDPAYQYALRIPKNFTKSAINFDELGQASASFIKEVGNYVGPPVVDGIRPYVRVSAQRLARAIHADDWLTGHLKARSFNIRKMRTDKMHDARTVYTGVDRSNSLDLNTPFAFMSRAIISGDFVVMVTVAYPIQAFKGYADVMARVIDSFKLDNPQEVQIEKLRRFALLDALSFTYPGSWSIKKPDFKNNERYSVEIHNISKDNLIYGEIRIEAIRNQEGVTSNDLIQRHVAELQQRGKSLGKLVGTYKAPESPKFVEGVTEIYSLKTKEMSVDQEYWFYFIKGSAYSYFVTLETPAQIVAYENWFHNKAIFLNIIASFE